MVEKLEDKFRKPNPRVIELPLDYQGPFTPEQEKEFMMEILRDMKPIYDSLNRWRDESLNARFIIGHSLNYAA